MNRLFFIYCLLISGIEGNTQVTKVDSTVSRQTIEKAVQHFKLFEGDQSRLYNGKIYRDSYGTISTGHPYFYTHEFIEGRIHYDGIEYKIPLQYNVVTEEVIINRYDNLHRISLINEKVKDFTLGVHPFIRMVENSSDDLLRTGYYEQLYTGKVKVYKKTTKRIKETIVNQKIVKTIETDRNFYVYKDSTWHKASNIRSVLGIFRDQKNAVNQLLKTNKIKFRKTPDEALVSIAAYYEALTR